MAHFAYRLQDSDRVTEESNVKDRQDELDVGIMAYTVFDFMAASLAESTIFDGS